MVKENKGIIIFWKRHLILVFSSSFEADTQTVVHLQAGDAGRSFTSVLTQVPVLMVSFATT